MVRILCATFGQVHHENGVPSLVLGNAHPFARLQCLLFGAFPDFRPFLEPSKTRFSRLWEMSFVLKMAFSTAPETVKNPETPKTKNIAT
jgi:hypothetical protein